MDKRVVSDPDKIRAMGPAQAWENYLSAMAMVIWARRIRRRASEKTWGDVARQSLDQHFAGVEAKRRARASAPGAQWEPWA